MNDNMTDIQYRVLTAIANGEEPGQGDINFIRFVMAGTPDLAENLKAAGVMDEARRVAACFAIASMPTRAEKLLEEMLKRRHQVEADIDLDDL